MDRVAEGGKEALEASGDGVGVAPGDDLDMDEPRQALDSDEHIGRLTFEASQVLEVDMHIAERHRLEALVWRGRLRTGRTRDAVALQASVDGAAR